MYYFSLRFERPCKGRTKLLKTKRQNFRGKLRHYNKYFITEKTEKYMY